MGLNAGRRLLLVSSKPNRAAVLRPPPAGSAFRLVESSDPRQALRRLSREPFEAVAVELPRAASLDFVSRVRERHPAVIVALVIPRKDDAFRKIALDAGAHAVVATRLNTPARLGLLETAIQTVQLAILNRKLAKTAWTTARSLVRVIQASQVLRAGRTPRPHD